MLLEEARSLRMWACGVVGPTDVFCSGGFSEGVTRGVGRQVM